MRTEFLCISVLRVASGHRVKLASCKSALNPPVVYSTDRSKAVVPVLVLLFVGLWFILRGDLLYVLPCVILFLCFSVLLVLDLSVSSFSWCLGRAAVCDCGTPWTFLLPFFHKGSNVQYQSSNHLHSFFFFFFFFFFFTILLTKISFA